MSSGLSMTSVNKIKELAEAREYSLAVDILDSQDLEKSLNPQFLRVCGEVYENVGRLKDARNMYVKAHIMGPQSNRILFSLITFYLKQGYFGLAEQYKDQYNATAKGQEQKNIEYVMQKAKRAKPEELRDYLDPYYTHSLDEEWSFELFLVLTLMGADTEMLAADYQATFRRSTRSETVQEILAGKVSAEELLYVFADMERPDQDPEQSEIRELEKEQLRKDYRRLHPESVSEEQPVETDEEIEDENAEILEEPDTEKKFKSFLKKKFRKKKEEAEDEAGTPEKPEGEETSSAEEGDTAAGSEESGEAASKEVAENAPAEDTVEIEEQEPAAEAEESPKEEPETSAPTEAPAKQEEDPDRNPYEDVISIDFDDGFAAESELIADLDETEEAAYQNPLDLINLGAVYREETARVEAELAGEPEPEPEPIVEEKPEPVEEPEPVAEEPVAEAEPEPVEDSEPEPESIEEEPAEEPEVEAVAEEAPTIEPEYEPEPIIDEETESFEDEEPINWDEPEEIAVPEPSFESAEPEFEAEPIIEAKTEAEPVEEEMPVVEETPIIEPEYEPGPILEEESETFENEEPVTWDEPEPVVEEEPEPEPIVEPEPEPVVEEEPEPVVEEEPEPIAEPEPEPIVEPEPEPVVEAKPEPEPVVEETSEPVAEEESEAEKEWRAARSALDALAENEKLDEGLAEEERLQREAEALLASLGIKL